MLTRDRILSIKARANGCATCDDWSHGPGGLLTAILTSGGLQAQAPIDDAPIAGTSQCDAEQSPSALSPNPYEAPKRRLWADKRAGRVSVKDAHRLKDSSPQHKSVVSNGRHTLRGAERPPKRGEKRDETQDSRTSKGKAAALELPTRVPLPTVPRLTLANGSFFGRDSGDFTFSMPADSFNNAVILGLRAEPTSGIDAENDDMDIDMDVDMSGNPEDHLTNAYPEAQRRQTSEFAAQPTLASQALSKPPATPHPPDLNAPTDGQQQQREIIYLDESPERNRLLGQAHSTSMSAIDMSRSVASFMHTPWSCGLTDLLEEQLAKYLSSSWHEDSRMAFAPPKWGSATVMLTLVLFHWHGVFSEVFSRSLPALIRESLPWVMWVEGLAECPQTTRPLPLSLRFKPFTYSSRASTTNSADSALDEEGIQEAERRAETRKLIHLARNMLAQCHLIESDERQRYRKKVVEGWVAWCDTHS
ncbi:hypothetical protein IW152_006013 [Coemansia sp. BCRC 34962]|nr:hypothetical protein IW152_006013 [Coemansia sp. BCRC 34962]